MRTLVHLSDLHFGRTDPRVVEAVRAQVRGLRPDVLIVSGDFTQRARPGEFRAARVFLDSLPGAKIVVPGNHDIPLWNVVARFAFPLRNYRRFISPDPAPLYHDDEVVVLGINTARSLTWKGGRISPAQAESAHRELCRFGEGVVKVIVTHHPFDLAETYGEHELVGRAAMALSKLAACGADVFLAGHLHEAYTGGTANRYRIHGYSALVVQAGTATSTRVRGSPNSFNVLRIAPPRVEVDVLAWEAGAGRFVVAEEKAYERRAGEGFVRLEV